MRRAAIRRIVEMSDDEDEIAVFHGPMSELVPLQVGRVALRRIFFVFCCLLWGLTYSVFFFGVRRQRLVLLLPLPLPLCPPAVLTRVAAWSNARSVRRATDSHVRSRG